MDGWSVAVWMVYETWLYGCAYDWDLQHTNSVFESSPLTVNIGHFIVQSPLLAFIEVLILAKQFRKPEWTSLAQIKPSPYASSTTAFSLSSNPTISNRISKSNGTNYETAWSTAMHIELWNEVYNRKITIADAPSLYALSRIVQQVVLKAGNSSGVEVARDVCDLAIIWLNDWKCVERLSLGHIS